MGWRKDSPKLSAIPSNISNKDTECWKSWHVTKQSFKIISKMGGHFFQSCEYDDMSPHLCQLNRVPPHEPWFQAHSSLLSWQNSYPWAWATVLRTRGYTSQRFLLSCQRDFKHQQMAHWQKQGGWQLHHLCQDHSS